MVAELAIERLGEIGQPENRGVAGIDAEVLENDFLAGIDAGFTGPDPVVGLLHVMGGDGGVMAHEDLPSIDFPCGELAGF